jgi:hypothetical protein
MQIVIGNVLSSEELGLVRTALRRVRFVDGAATAGKRSNSMPGRWSPIPPPRCTASAR